MRQQNTALAATITASLVARPYLPDEVTILLQNELESKDMCESALPVARAFEASPHKDTNWKRLVQNCLGWLGRTEEAVSYARTLTGDDRSAVANTLAWDLVLLGRPAEAVAELEPVISNGNPSVHKLHTLATALVEAGRPDDAQAIVADALRERRSLTDDWWYVIGRLAQVWGMEDAAQASFERVEHSDDPRSTWALVLKARAAAPPPGAVLTPR